MGATISTWNFESTDPRWSKIADFEPIITRSASAVTPSKKSWIITNKKSPTHFPVSLRWSSYVAPKSPKKGSKTQNGRFPSKIALRLKKVCYKVSLCENCQRQSCKAFIGLTIRAKIIGGDISFCVKCVCVTYPRGVNDAGVEERYEVIGHRTVGHLTPHGTRRQHFTVRLHTHQLIVIIIIINHQTSRGSSKTVE